MTREQLIKYTAKNPTNQVHRRFPDGRPKVPDALLEKFKDMSSEEIGLSRSGFPNQYVDGLQVLHPDKKLIGRAVTLQLMPIRGPILRTWTQRSGKRRGTSGRATTRMPSTCCKRRRFCGGRVRKRGRGRRDRRQPGLLHHEDHRAPVL
jgi:hypothetical protein